MRTFYVFKLNKNYITPAKKEPYNIYLLLNSIYSYKRTDITIPFNLFKEVCIPINKDFFDKYFYDKLNNDEGYTKFKSIHMYHNYFTGEESKMAVNISHIKIKSNIEENIFITNLIDGLFICDFKNSICYFCNKSYDSRVGSKVV